MPVIVQKIINIIRERRLPWRIGVWKENAASRYHYYIGLMVNRFSRSIIKAQSVNNGKRICFICGFHGKTGGVFAIASIANMLSRCCNVMFSSFPTSSYNRILERSVTIASGPDWRADIFICDVTCDHKILKKVKAEKKRLIVSCHGMPVAGHGLTEDRVKGSLMLADLVHFVSSAQQQAFQLKRSTYVVIPNTTAPVLKYNETMNAGVVGRLDDPQKNAHESVEIALSSDAQEVHLWGIEQNYWSDSRVKVHSWETDKGRIYGSFDVLVFMSRDETFGMVVIEAMSAGIPCVLSNLPAFTQFKSCPGIKIIDSNNRKYAGQIVTDLLKNRKALRQDMIRFWKEHYSTEVIANTWEQLIRTL